MIEKYEDLLKVCTAEMTSIRKKVYPNYSLSSQNMILFSCPDMLCVYMLKVKYVFMKIFYDLH